MLTELRFFLGAIPILFTLTAPTTGVYNDYYEEAKSSQLPL